jgi:uncharacterized membrane protein YbhN (UPF0104 family)
MFSTNKNIKLVINYGLGPILFCWLSYSIWQQVSRQPDLGTALHHLKSSFYSDRAWKLWAAGLLMFFNWGLEARKWQVLLRPLEPIGLGKAFKAILAGVAFAMNTPNRIGEFGGRVLYVHEGHRWKAVSLTIIGSLSQLIITLLGGAAGLFFLLKGFEPVSLIEPYRLWLKVLFFGTLGVAFFLLLLYFRLAWMVQWLERIPAGSRFLKHIAVIENLRVTILLRVIGLSMLRYMVFVIQFILLLQLFDVNIDSGTAFWLVSVLYLVLAIIPTIALAELGIRGQVSLWLFTLVSSNKLGIEAAALSIWLMNLVIPALVGSLLFLGIKILSEK